MKRWWVLLLVLGLALAMAAPAAAKKLENPGNKPPPAVGKTCEEAFPTGSWSYEVGDFPVSLNGKSDEHCADVATHGEGTWIFTVDVTGGTVRRLVIALRDSASPGDACGSGVIEAAKLGPGTHTFTVTGVPAAEPDACGPDFPDTGNELTEDQFALLIFMWAQGKDRPTVDVYVDVP